LVSPAQTQVVKPQFKVVCYYIFGRFIYAATNLFCPYAKAISPFRSAPYHDDKRST